MLGNPPMPAEAEIYRPKASHVWQRDTRHRIVAGLQVLAAGQLLLLPAS
jgi:hypothetical protein